MTRRSKNGRGAAVLLVAAVLVVGTTGCPIALQVTPPTATITITGTVQLTAVSAVFSQVTWSSSNAAVATVDPTTGLVTGVSAGTATISATVPGAQGASASSVITVVNGVVVSPSSAYVDVGGVQGYAATSSDVLDTTFTWGSSNAAIATVSTAGVVTGVAAGQATITATGSNSGTSGTATAIVRAPATFVGSATCGACHPTYYDDWVESGHPYKVSKIVNGQPPQFPFAYNLLHAGKTAANIPNTPVGYTWNDITYTIGGYGWKGRFMDSEGYILTETDPASGFLTQYNLATQGWVAYSHPSAGQTNRKPYDCGKCHTTGWIATGAAGPHQDNLPGIYGTWEAPGVHCEQCHGWGSHHVQTQSKDDITVDDTAQGCGSCHFRDSQHRIAASGGFIKHHEQFDEMIAGPHKNLKCVECHDPHKSTVYTPSVGIIKDCDECHTKTIRPSMSHLECKDCHMPRASKSAVAFGPLEGDIRTHIFAINTDAVDAATGLFYTEDGKTFARGAVTMDFACQFCHDGARASTKTLAELAAVADDIHP